MTSRRALFALAAAAVVVAAGCGHAPARAAASAPAHKARIVLGVAQGAPTHVVVFDGARRLGTLQPGEWAAVDVKPGTHYLFARAADEAACIRATSDEPCSGVGVLAAEVHAGRVYYANVTMVSRERLEILRATAATTEGTRESRFAIAPLDETDRFAIQKGQARMHSDPSWSAAASSLAHWHGESALAMERWMVTP
jgi:hypothetical protein